MKSAKLQHHVELALSEGVFPVSKLTAEAITDACATITTALRNKYTEYKFEAPTKLRDSVRETLTDYLESKKETTKVVAVPSMNQALVNQYNASGSKRQRPDDYNDNGSKVTASSEGGELDGSGSGEGKTQSTSSQQQSQKRARKSSGHNGAGSGAGGRRSQAMITADSTEGDVTSMIEGTLGGNKKENHSPYFVARPPHRLSHLAGLDATIEQVKELTFLPIQQPQLYKHLGVSAPCGILLKGPSGCGKTSMANGIAGELGLPYFRASGPELIGGTSGESEERIRDIFAAASSKAPSVLFIDAIDVIAAKSDAAGQRGMERRVIAQLLDSIDALIAAGNNMTSDPAELSRGSSGNGSDAAALKDAPSDKEEGSVKSVGEGASSADTHQGHVILLCATNKPDSLDATVRGRLSRELSLPVPDKESRARILTMMTRSMKVAPDVDHDLLGQLTPGYVGADLQTVAREAGMIAVARIVAESGSDSSSALLALPPPPATDAEMAMSREKEVLAGDDEGGGGDGAGKKEGQEQEALVLDTPAPDSSSAAMADDAMIYRQLEALGAKIQMSDFRAALKQVQPSATREGFAVVPNVTWADVGALSEVREELLHNLLEPIAHPERFRSLGLEVPAGVLFFGPPGCGKTLLAKAVANQSGANFISVKGPELLNMFVGESESRVRQVFSRARASAPCVIFFDELDALCPKRGSGDGGGGGSNVTERVVNQLLTELDGLEARKDVYIIAATNRLELIDDAMLRPGRLGKLLYVPLPNAEDRVSILRALCRKVNLGPTTEEGKGEGEGEGECGVIDLGALMRDERAEGFSGADCAAFLREAGLAVMREWLQKHPLPSSSAESSSSSSSRGGDEAEWENPRICARHFEAAFGRSRPSVSEKDRRRYEMVHRLIKEEGKPPIQALHIAATKFK